MEEYPREKRRKKVVHTVVHVDLRRTLEKIMHPSRVAGGGEGGRTTHQ